MTAPGKCWRDGEIVALDDVALGVDSAGTRYSVVVFDGLAAVPAADGRRVRILDLPAHLARFARSCDALGLELRYDEARLTEAVLEVAADHPVDTPAGIRLFAYATGEDYLDREPTSVCVFLRGLARYAPDRPLRLAVADARRPARTDLPRWIKATAHYAGTRRSVLAARAAGADDALFLNEHGRVTEASRASLVVLCDEGLVAPPVEEGVLPGITRTLLARVAEAAFGWRVEYRPLELDEVLAADGALLCSSSLGAGTVGAIDGYALPTDRAAALAAAFTAAARGVTSHLDAVATVLDVASPAVAA